MKLQQIYPDLGIWVITVKGGYGGLKPPVNIYVIPGENGIIYDAGYGDRGSIKYVVAQVRQLQQHLHKQNKPANVSRILISHCHPDHFSGLKRLKAELGVKIVLTKQMNELITSPAVYRQSYDDFHHYTSNNYFKNKTTQIIQPIIDKIYAKSFGMTFIDGADQIIEENSHIQINNETWEIFHSPGHSEDHISLYHPGKGVLFSGDNVMRSITSWLGPPKSNVRQYVNSLKYLMTLPKLALILSAHGSPVIEPKKRIQELIDWRLQRSQQVYDIIDDFGDKGGGRTEILKKIYPQLNWAKQYLAEGWVILTLEDLIARKRILKIKKHHEVVYIVRRCAIPH